MTTVPVFPRISLVHHGPVGVGVPCDVAVHIPQERLGSIYKLHQLPNGLVLVRNFHGLLIRGNRWTWKAENLARNTIDFFMTIEAKTFNETMELLCSGDDNLPDEPASARRPSPDDDDGHEPL